MKRRSRTAQASLEFLLTYGWAFIAILAAFGVITYMGLSNPERFAPQNCVVGDSFECTDFGGYFSSFGGDGYVTLFLQNNVGHRIAVNQIEVRTFAGTDVACMTSMSVTASSGGDSVSNIDLEASDNLLVAPGQSIDVRLICTGGEILEGDLIKTEFIIRYKIDKPGYFDKTIFGRAVVKAILEPES